MTNKEMKKIIDEKIFMMNGFRLSCYSMGTISPEFMPYKMASNLFLESLMLELMVKTFFELDKMKKAKKTHHIKTIFNTLKDEYKDFIKGKFLESETRYKEKFKAVIDEGSKISDLEECLDHNYSYVTNFKYTPVVQGSNRPIDDKFFDDVIIKICEEASKIVVS